jgi:hypothetical protein
MDWEIFSFAGIGPIKFGMSPRDVEKLLGKPLAVDEDDDYRKEVRAADIPSVTYEDNEVVEIEAFSEVQSLFFGKIKFFQDPALNVLRQLEEMNKGARINVGVLLFENLGITTGRLDSDVPLEHSVTVFKKGYWDDSAHRFKRISFK